MFDSALNTPLCFQLLYGKDVENKFNDTHREKPCFTLFSTRMAAWLLLTFFSYVYTIS